MSGEVSIALSFSFKPEPGVVVRLTLPAPVMALMRCDHDLARHTTVQLADIARFPVLLQDPGTTNRQLFDIACNVEGIEIVPFVSSRYVAALVPFRTKRCRAPSCPQAMSRLQSDWKATGWSHCRSDNPLLQQRRLQVKTLAGRPLDGLAQECMDWIVQDLNATAKGMFGI